MLKRKYLVNYTVRPNKKTPGKLFSRNMTLTGRAESANNKKRLEATLAIIHRVNPDAVEIESAEQTGIKIELFSWLARKFGQLIGKAA